jgi:hypothetical protein
MGGDSTPPHCGSRRHHLLLWKGGCEKYAAIKIRGVNTENVSKAIRAKELVVQLPHMQRGGCQLLADSAAWFVISCRGCDIALRNLACQAFPNWLAACKRCKAWAAAVWASVPSIAKPIDSDAMVYRWGHGFQEPVDPFTLCAVQGIGPFEN